MGHRLAFRLRAEGSAGLRRGVTCGLLTTTGRRTGRTRTVPIMFLADGDRFLIVAANSGFDPAPRLVSQPAGELVGEFPDREGDV